jgi:hypothetical protein
VRIAGTASGVYVVNSDGTALRRILGASGTNAIDAADRPAWSPDGRRIAYANGPLRVVDLAGHARTLARGPACNAIWAPDGQSLVYLAGRCAGHGGYGDRRYAALLQVPATGGRPRVIARGSIDSPSFSPNATRLAYTNECKGYPGGTHLCNVYVAGRTGLPEKVSGDQWSWVRWLDERRLIVGQDAGLPLTTAILDLGARKFRDIRVSGSQDATVSADGRLIALTRYQIPPLVLVANDPSARWKATVPRGWKFIGAAVYLR